MAAMYSLTHLTGRRKNDGRSIVVATVEMNRFTFLVGGVSAALSLPVAVIVGILLVPFGASVGAIVVPFFGICAGLILMDQRTKGGLQQQRGITMLDTHRARSGKGRKGVADASVVYVATKELVAPQMVFLVQSSIPNPSFFSGAHSSASTFVPAIGKSEADDTSTAKRSFL